MPKRRTLVKKPDIPAIASKLPEVLQKPAASIAEFLTYLNEQFPLAVTGFDIPRRIPAATAAKMLPQAVERANEQGYTTPVYHGTQADFQIFRNPISTGRSDFGIHVTPDPDTASRAVGSPPELYGEQYVKPWWVGNEASDIKRGPRIMPLLARIKNLIELPDMGSWESPGSWKDHLMNPDFPRSTNILTELERTRPNLMEGLIDTAKAFDAKGRMIEDPRIARSGFQQAIKALLQRNGIDAVAYPNFAEGRGEHSLMLLDPRQLKSLWANFDPLKFGKDPNILASLGGAAAIAGLQRRKPDGR